MGLTKREALDWKDPLLQGLAYWLGYKHQLFKHYPLSEGAIVGEALSLIYNNLRPNEELFCEKMFKTFHDDLLSMGNARADIIIEEDSRLKIIIEVKRIQAPRNAILEDFKKLAKAKNKLPHVRCFLLLASPNFRPQEFVTEKGVGNRRIIYGEGYKLLVKRVCKASDTFKKINAANYACLIEVDTNEA